MPKLEVQRNQFVQTRIWELFSPNTHSFGFWLATASFTFFAYQSIIPARLETVMEWTRGVTSAVFLFFGYFCIAVLIYLAITWILNIRITKKKTEAEKIVEMKRDLELITKKAEELNRIINDYQNGVQNDTKHSEPKK